jgi:gliding motility-associated-like protein
LNEASFSLDTTICEDETLQLGGMTFSEGNPSGTVTLENAAQNGCDSIITVNVAFQSLSIEYDLIPPSCELGTNTQIEFINPIGTNDYIFYLNNNETAIPQTPYVLDGLNAGMNTFYIQSQIGCESPVESATIEEPQNIEVAIADISPINLGDSALLEGQTNLDPSTIQWTPMDFITCDSCLTTLVYPEQTTTFQLEVTDENGCTGSAEITVVVIEEEGASVYIPNVFSPNGDNINDYFTVYTEEGYAVINRLMIFDRWGELLFEERNIATNIEQSGWDGSANGEELSPGVYVYAIELENSSGQTTVYHGTITLVK